MTSHALRLILPGSTEPAEPVTTASATITNLHYPHARGELSGGGGLTLAEWENTTFNTTMSPVYDIAHVFTAPVRSFTNGLHGQTSELTMAAQHLTGILYGYFESVGLGDYPMDPQWGEVFLFTKQSIPSINGLYIALPGDVPSAGNRVLRAFIKLNVNLSVQYTPVHFRATENVPVTVQPSGTSLRLFDVAQDALALSAAQGGMPLDTTDAAWVASSSEPWFKYVNFEWIDTGPFSGNNDHQFVFLELLHQTDPTENGVWRYDFATGSQIKGVTPYRKFTRMPIGIPNLNSNPQMNYFSFNVRASNGSLHYGQVTYPGSSIVFGTGSLALMLEDPGAATVNKPVTTLTPQSRHAYTYEYAPIAGHPLGDGSWLFGTAQGHDVMFILRATEADGVFTAGSSDANYRTAPVGTSLSALTIIEFEALPLATAYGESSKQLTNPFLFLSNAALSVEAGADVPPVKGGRIELGKEFEAQQVALTHTSFYASRQATAALLDELRLRGLAVTFGHLLHGHGHSHSGSGNERSRPPHFHIFIEYATTSTMVSRHNMHYKSMHIPHLIDFQYVYEDTGESLTDAHAELIGQVVLTLTFEGFTV